MEKDSRRGKKGIREGHGGTDGRDRGRGKHIFLQTDILLRVQS